MSLPSSASATNASSSSTAADLVASLSISTHPELETQLQYVNGLIKERRFKQAEGVIKQFMADMQRRIKEATTATTATPSAADSTSATPNQPSASSNSSSASTSLPSLSQLMSTFLPQLRTLTQLRRESENGDYDFDALTLEMDNLRKNESNASAPARRSAHAEYVHPLLTLAEITPGCRGILATDSIQGCARACAPATVNSDSSATTSVTSNVCIPANTTLMCSRAIGLVTDNADVPLDAASADAQAEKMANALVTLLALKMNDATLIPAIYQLDAGAEFQNDREQRLQRIHSPFDAYRPATDESTSTNTEPEVDPNDLAIDLSRLALIVSRNAFEPPSDSVTSIDAPHTSRSTGLWIPSSFINHSCRPNAHWFVIGDWMVIRSLRPIMLNEEITISYTGFDAKLYSARHSRCAGFGFDCQCQEWCQPFKAHPNLSEIETQFVLKMQLLEPKIHELVDSINQSQEGTVTYKNFVSELKACQTELEESITQFQSQLKLTCVDCKATESHHGPEVSVASLLSKMEFQIDDAPTKSTTSASANKKKHKKAAQTNGTFITSTITNLINSTQTLATLHTHSLLIHLALPFTLLALCQINLLDPESPMMRTYQLVLALHEQLYIQAIDLLGRHYGPGDEVVIFTWFELFNTWMQFDSSGVEYRSIDEIKSLMAQVEQRHCQQMGVKPIHFKRTWRPLAERMGLTELME